MKIKSIELTNLKGVTRLFEIGKHTLIRGENASGKTAIIDGLALACLGYHPTLGKTKAKIAMLASADNMSSIVTFDDGRKNAFHLSKKEGIQHDAEVKVPDTLFSYNAFASLTASKRTTHLMQLCEIPDIKEEDVRKKLLKFLDGKKVNIAAAIEVADTFKSVLDDAPEHNIALFDTIVEQFKADAKSKKELAAEISAVLTSAAGAIPPKQVEIDDVVKMNQDLATMREMDSLFVTKQERDAALVELNGLHNDAAETEGEIQTDPAELNAQIDSISQELQAHSVKLGKHASTIQHTQEAIDVIQLEMEGVMDMACCPTCKSKAKAWKKGAEKEYLSQIAVLHTKKDEAAEAMEGIEKDHEAGTKKRLDLSTTRDAQAQIERELREIRKKISKIEGAQEEREKVLADKIVPEVKPDIPLKEAEVRVATAENKEWVKHQAMLANAEENSDELAGIQAIAEGCRVAAKYFEAAKVESIEEAISELLKNASSTTTDVFGKSLGFANGQFYLVALPGSNETSVPLDTMSGAESLIVQAILRMFITPNLEFSPVIMDELGVLHAGTAGRLTEHMDKADWFDQFIGLSANEIGAPKGWTTIEVNGSV